MQVAATLVLLVTCELCLAIRVPVNWDESASEVKQEIKNDNDQFSDESFKPETINDENVNVNSQDDTSIPVEYFQYTAKKPQFAVDVSKFHGVQSPKNHYKAYPIKPYTGKAKPELGKHHLFDQRNTVHKPFQEFTNINEDIVSHAVPVSSNYEVFHPYEAETPALQEIYKDPILNKIRNDLENSKNRHQAYEKEAGEQDNKKKEYLESPDVTDNKFIPQGNKHAPYEIHRPQRRPVYYRPVIKNHHREHHLNQRLRHPWNQYSAKIRPMHYRPVKNHIQQLRQNHALKYDDERNEYPQVHILENYSSDPQDGYDIYERGKEKFVQLRNNVDESISKTVKENRPETYQKLEMQNEDHPENYNENDDEFVPIKNYAQVRKTETYKHLPRSAALEDAENFDEIRNAPRLREAVKSTKAQTVYSEEGYEDSAYDHAGEQKHASENEGHGGYLKEHELSGGKYKTPSESAKYEDDKSSVFRDHVIHAEKWKNDNTDTKEEKIEEDYSEDEQEEAFEAKKGKDNLPEDVIYRNKRENDIKNDSSSDLSITTDNTTEAVDIHNRNENFNVPELDFKSTFLTEDEIIKLSKIRIEPKKDNIKDKYPYYFKNLDSISKHSPLRYAENLKLIPKKSKGGTEFYDSRSKFECPEVDDVPNPIPEKLNRDGHPDGNSDEDNENSSTKGDVNYDTANKTPRLKGLGDKIDCFKAKYFGENPLDSPFFKEEIILNPEPVTLPNLASYNFKPKSMYKTDSIIAESQHKTALDPTLEQKVVDSPDVFTLIEKLRNGQFKTLDSLKKNNDTIWLPTKTNISKTNEQQLNNIKYSIKGEESTLDNDVNVTKFLTNTTTTPSGDNITYNIDQNKKHITLLPSARKKRSTSFVYEPYKIIKEGQVQDSKKTTTSSNISPLIRQLQLSRIVDRVPRLNQEVEQLEKHVKRNVNSRVYKEVDRKSRAQGKSKNDKEVIDPTFVDVSVDSRRGEPRYEIIQSNHKSKYSPTENKKSMSVEEYKLQTGKDKEITTTLKGETSTKKQSQQRTPISRLDKNTHTLAESSNTVQTKVSTTPKNPAQLNPKESEEDYEEYDYEEESITITTTTLKPSFRRKIRPPTVSEKKLEEDVERPKLKLITRFRDYKSKDDAELDEIIPEKDEPKSRKVTEEKKQVISDEIIPKYREKKRKSTKSTLVTDTKRYGDENDDENKRKEEVDAMIRVNQDMDDYLPLYELEEKNKLRTKDVDKMKESHNKNKEDGYVEKRYQNKNSSKGALKNDDNTDENEDDEDYDDNVDHDVNDDDDDEIDDDDDVDDDDSHEDEESEDDEDDISEVEVLATTPEPTRRTLAITTDAPKPTTATHITRPELTPIITRKKIEIHHELPVNKSAPHITQFKQDIKEVEMIKETPNIKKKKPQKNLEALELYKDDNLAKDINKLGGVEIFKEGIDLKNGPRHGGNYRSLDSADANVSIKKERDAKHIKEDTEASQSEFTKHIELEEKVPSNKMHGGNFRSLNDAHRSRNRGRSSKLIELSDPPSTLMHGGNLRHRGKGRNSSKSQKLVELDDDHDNQDDHDLSNNHESFSNSRTSRPMHGGNYRSAKIVTEEKPKSIDQPIRSRTTGPRRNSAAILNSFVQVAPILTTTPAYILDPSKRMYYYVDA